MVLYYSLSNRKSRGGKINIVLSFPPPGGSMKHSCSAEHSVSPHTYPLTNHPLPTPTTHPSTDQSSFRRHSPRSAANRHKYVYALGHRTRARTHTWTILSYNNNGLYINTHTHAHIYVYQRARRTCVRVCASGSIHQTFASV